MVRALWLPDVLTDAGCKVRTVEGWETRGKDTKLRPFKPLGVLEHHTATKASLSTAGLLTLIVRGRLDLPGPLAQLVPDRDGWVYVVASGVANHAGAGKWKGLTSNRVLFGLENANDGRGEPWPSAQIDAIEKTTAAICEQIERDASYVAGHKEYATPSGRKIDPANFDMATFRIRIAELLEEDDMEPILKEGDVGNDVALWKKAVNKAAEINKIPLPPAPPGTWYSPEMTALVAAYQESASVLGRPGVEKGRLDPYTMLLLVEYTREGD